MGHGKSRPLRNLSKKKGFSYARDHRAILTIIKQKIFYSKVESACLGVSAGKACVW